MKTKQFFLLMTAILMMVGIQQAKADSNQPRFMLPTTQMTETNSFDLASIYASSPYFTIYLWVKNSDNLDSYWNEAPTLKVDGHGVTLGHLRGTSVDYSHYYEYVCYEPHKLYSLQQQEEKIYYYVHVRPGFKAGDNTKFKEVYGPKLGTNYKSDYYVPIDIFVHENRLGETHTVSVRGKVTIDRGKTDYMDVEDQHGNTTITCMPTVTPFKLFGDGTTLKWTSPGNLTFTSDNFDDCSWGRYQVVLDGLASDKQDYGKITVTKNYGDNADYRDTTAKAVEYRYEGVFDTDFRTARNESPGTATIVTKYKQKGGAVAIMQNLPNYYFMADSHCSTAFCADQPTFLKDDGYHFSSDTWFTLTCLDKKIRQVEVRTGSNKKIAEWSGDDWSCKVFIPKDNIVTKVIITYDRGVNGYPIIFTENNEHAPETLPYPTNLTAQYDAWGKKITLTWEVGKSKAKDSSGTHYLYRDGILLTSITTGGSLKYEDENVNYDQNYQYTVYFKPNDWEDGTLDPKLSVSTTATLQRTVSLSDLSVLTDPNGYMLSWSIQPEFDKSGYKFLVYRRQVTASEGNLSPADFTGLEPIVTVEVLNKGQTQYSYFDKDVTSTVTYAYMVAIKGLQDCNYYTMPVIPDGHPDTSQIVSLSASRGTYTDHVHLSWEEMLLGQDKLVYTLYRHRIEEGENEVTTLAQAKALKWDKIATFESTKNSPVNSYDDKTALGGYYYLYAMVACPNGSESVFSRKIFDGFIRSTGNVNGFVTYEDNQFAVQGVKVTLQSSATTNPRVFNSLRLTGSDGGVHWNNKERISTYFEGPYSVQMYVRPNGSQTSGACLLDMGDQLKLTLGDYDESKGGYPISVNGSQSTRHIKADRFSHLTFTYDGSSKAILHIIDPDQLDSIYSQDFDGSFSPVGGNGIAVGSTTDNQLTLNGYVDEVRFFKHQLTVKDVEQNFCHYLGGSEYGLVAYWSFDESISTMRLAYDKSKDGETANENHANIASGRRSNVEIPTLDQLSLYAVTDTTGLYTLSGIPFADEGTSYSLVPTKGAHKFNPTKRSIYVSPSTLNFDSQNFTDNSSFNVKGVVYYENTTYPVKGCRFRVDDTVVKDEWGNEILSDENGEYTIPVSIGQHAIYIEKDGHTFLNNGRYPASGLHNFNDSISGLTFTDLTKAIVVGRVAGGHVEKEKPLALGQSKANIGVATLTLLTSISAEDARRMNVTLDSEEGIYRSNDERRYYEQANPDYVHSEAWVGGLNDGADGVKFITIKTDSLTGEFAVKLPPVPYYIKTQVDNNPEATASFEDNVLLDCSNVLNVQTAVSDNLSFDYNSALVQTYYAVPEISVVQTDNEDGAFGDARVSAGELNDSVDTWQKKDGQLVYNYGYPIFTSGLYYTFDIKAFERYVNYDANANHPEEELLPSSEGYLTFSNPMVLAATDTIAQLDSDGCYTYTFQALEPNVVAPYVQPVDITLTIGDNVYLWNWHNGDHIGALQGVVFGAKATGQTSVVSAPDVLVNILRDPFGSNSNIVWNSGSTRQKAFNIKVSGGLSGGYNATFGTKTGGKAAVGAPGLYVGVKGIFSYNVGAGLSGGFSLSANGGCTWQWSNSKEYQTSTEPTFDGPAADLFIGATSSLVYGDGLQVMLVDDQAGGFRIGSQEVIATGQRMETDFAYTQDYIVTQLIPDFKRLREARLVQVSESELESLRSSFRNETDSIIYMTSLTPDDPRFGTNNNDSIAWGDQAVELEDLSWTADSLCCYGPSYSVFLPANDNYRDEEERWDAIATINSNIQLWEYYLSINEEGKVKALALPDKDTYSFDSGSSISITHEEAFKTAGSGSLTISANAYLKLLYRANISSSGNGTAMKGDVTGRFKFNLVGTLKGGTGKTDSYTVNLDDPVDDNSHQIRMAGATEGYGGINNDGRDDFGGFCFYQTSGQTSCYYEGEERTKYYYPGWHILSEATVPVEVPSITCDNPVVTSVPAGQPAVFDLTLTNASQANITRPVYFQLLVVKDEVSQKAEVSINGDPGINDYEVVLNPGEEATVKMKVMPASNEVISIDSLHLFFYCKNEPERGQNYYLSAFFQPQPEPVTLETSTKLVNTATGSTLKLSASGYNYNSKILNGVRLQQRKDGAPEWTTIHSWVKGTPAGDTESPLPTERIDTLIDMQSSILYPDATYLFRAVTDCTVSDETALGESETIYVTKDVTLPQPIQLPEPADGVLGEGDNISITFNEDIHSSSLNEVDNFVIQSVLNTDSVAHDVALRLDGASIPAASSESQLMLDNSSFTLCGWVKSSGTAGTLYRHGEGKNCFRVDIDAEGMLTVYIRDENGVAQPYTSTKALPLDDWAYVAVVYDVEQGTLSAHYACGDNEDTLMDGVPVGNKLTSEGTIYLGEGLTGAMHELSLFSEPLSWTTIQAQMYVGKSHSTPSIIGYWKLDEGHGNKSEDRARSRHMILSSDNGWYLENPNLSWGLDGTHCAAIPMGTLSVSQGESYLVEMWALSDESQNANAQLLSLDNGQKFDLNIVDGQLQLVADSVTYNAEPSTSKLNDHQWHHVALNVLKGGGGQANLMVDGVSVLTVAADKVPALAGAYLWLGRNMKGMLDEVRLWHGTNTQETIIERMYYRLDAAKEHGLVGYYPMEETRYDEYNQRVFFFSLKNLATDSTTLVADAEGVEFTEGAEAPGLKMAPHKSNLDFHFVADERTVSVILDHSAKSLEGCTVSTTLRDYHDMHENVGTPITWSFVVKQNPLTWNTSEVSVSTKVGWVEDVTATLTNNGDEDQEWSLTDLPSWLDASPRSGTIFAHGTQEVTFTVLPFKGIGKYFTTVSARGNKELDTPLDICLTVKGESPAWEREMIGESMSVTGQIKINGVISTDPDDMIGAFTDPDGESLGRCIGVGQPKYDASKDAYYVTMLIVADTSVVKVKDIIRFRIYDASTGKVYPLTNVYDEVYFVPDTIVGSTANPVIWENRDKLLQTFSLNEGTNWISLYLKPVRRKVSELFSSVTRQLHSVQFADGEPITFNHDTGSWSGDRDGIDAGQMMMVQMDSDAELFVVGDAINPEDYPITVKPGVNLIGVPSSSYIPIDEAFASISPTSEDQVKNLSAMSYYRNNEWFGDIGTIEPGKGYKYISMASGERTLTFPSIETNSSGGVRSSNYGIAANYKYKQNMTAICTVHDEYGQPIQVKSLMAYDTSGELRGRATRCHNDSLYILVISGDVDGEPIVLVPTFGPQTSYSQRSFATLVHFKGDATIGSFSNPLVLQETSSTGIGGIFNSDPNSQLTIYNTQGLIIYRGPASDMDRQRQFASGVYIVNEVMPNGHTRCYKHEFRK